MLYCFYQTDNKGPWHLSLASERHNLIKTKGAKLITALDVDNDFSSQLTAEDQANLKQIGDLYFDFDDDLGECIENFKRFLVLLQAKDVDLNQCRLYATGNRGFHAFIPMQMYMPKIPPTGVVGLAHIYKEMAFNLYVDSMDGRIYSSSKGRQLRCANVQRDNGLWKVQITPEEAFSMTLEKYTQLCSSPRNELPIEPAKFNPDLGLLFATAQDKVTKKLAKKKTQKPGSDALAKFNGEWPEILKCVINGLGLRQEVGFNQIAMQVAITGAALGMCGSDEKEEKFLADCAGLINSHKGDSDRYGTPRKRRAFLRDMLRYAENNPLYEFSAGGVLSLVDSALRANSDIGLGDYVPDNPVDAATMVALAKNVDPAADASSTPEVVEIFEEDQGSVRVSKAGIFVRTDDGFKSISRVGLINPTTLRQPKGDYLGFEVEVYVDGKPEGVKYIPMSAFSSRGQFHGWAANQGGEMLGTDIHVGSLINIMRKKANRSGSVVYAVAREGVDLVVPPGCTDKTKFDVVWASTTEVIATGDTKYRFVSQWGKDGYSGTDLMNAPELTKDEDTEFVDHLLRINSDENLAKMLGWFSASFLTQLIRREMDQFPLLQVFGQAGAGKSATVKLLNGMHYYLKKPRQMASSGQTFFPIMTAVGTSASIPVVFEEMKPRQMQKQYKDQIQNLFRSNYSGDVNARGAVNKDKGQSELGVTDFNNSAPLVFVGEAIEDQSAIMERCVVVSLTKAARFGRGPDFAYCQAHATTMGKIGKTLVQAALSTNYIDLGNQIRACHKSLCEGLSEAVSDEHVRSLFNLAVALVGLEFFRETMSRIFGDRYDERIGELSDAIRGNVMNNIPNNMSECARVLDVMSQLSRNDDPNYRLQQGVDYTFDKDGKHMDLKVRTAYAKYVKWQRSLGMEVLFDTESAFITGLSTYSGTVRRSCPDNEILFDSVKAVVMRLSLATLEKEEVDSFKDA